MDHTCTVNIKQRGTTGYYGHYDNTSTFCLDHDSCQ